MMGQEENLILLLCGFPYFLLYTSFTNVKENTEEASIDAKIHRKTSKESIPQGIGRN